VSKNENELLPAPEFQSRGPYANLRAMVGLGLDSRHKRGVPGWLSVTALKGGRLTFTFHPDKVTRDSYPVTGWLMLCKFLQSVPTSTFPGEEPTFYLLIEQVMRSTAQLEVAKWIPAQLLPNGPRYMHVTLTGPLRDQLLVWIDGMVAEGLLP